MDPNVFVIFVFAVAFWCPLLYVLIQGSSREWEEGREAFAALVDEVAESSQRSWFPRSEGTWRGREVTLKTALGGGWIFAIATSATSLEAPASSGPALGADELNERIAELGAWRNRAKLRIRSGRLEAIFPQEAQFNAARLERCAPHLFRIAALLERREALSLQGDRIRCPYCHDLLQGGEDSPEPIQHCSACQTPHHSSCFAESGCTLLGCAEQRPRRARVVEA